MRFFIDADGTGGREGGPVVSAGTGRVWAYLAAIPPVTVSTFAANRLWTFSERD